VLFGISRERDITQGWRLRFFLNDVSTLMGSTTIVGICDLCGGNRLAPDLTGAKGHFLRCEAFGLVFTSTRYTSKPNLAVNFAEIARPFLVATQGAFRSC
jgi:hypothetical protein